MTLLNQDYFDLIDDVFRISNTKLLALAPFPPAVGTSIINSLNSLRTVCQSLQNKLSADDIKIKQTQVFSFQTLVNNLDKSIASNFADDLAAINTQLELVNKEPVDTNNSGVAAADGPNNNNTNT